MPSFSSTLARWRSTVFLLREGWAHRLVVVQLRDRRRSRVQALHPISATEDARMIVVAAEEAAGLVRLARCPVTVVPHGAASEIGVRDAWD